MSEVFQNLLFVSEMTSFADGQGGAVQVKDTETRLVNNGLSEGEYRPGMRGS